MVRNCAAFGCRSTGLACPLRSFPQDAEQRRLWVQNVNRLNWLPKKSSVLCDLHFESDQFEKTRDDGTKKLKCTAIPTLFGPPKHSKKPKSDHPQTVPPDHCYVKFITSRKVLGEVENHQRKAAPEGDHCYVKPIKSRKVLGEVQNLQSTPPRSSSHSDFSFSSVVNSSNSSHISIGSPLLNSTPCSANQHSVKSSMQSSAEILSSSHHTNSHSVSDISFGSPVLNSTPRSGHRGSTESTMEPSPLSSPVLNSTPRSGNRGSIESSMEPSALSSPQPINLNDASELETLRTLLEEQNKKISKLEEENKAKLEFIEKTTKLAYKWKRQACNSNMSLRRLKDSQCKSGKALTAVLHTDQFKALSRKSNQGLKWTSATIRDALVLKMRCGTSGYTAVVNKIPLYPSVRTLQKKVQHMKFESGLLHEVFDCMEVHAQHLNDTERDCVLTLDEMAIEPSERLDSSTNKWIGTCTLPNHSGIATKALVFMLSGVSTRWKQCVAYHLTKSLDPELKSMNKVHNFTGQTLKDIVLGIIKKAEQVKFRVCCVTCDMGPDNMAMWAAFGVGASRTTEVGCSIDHPERLGDKLFFMPDPVHLFKNIKRMLESNRTVNIPPAFVSSRNLSSSVVDYGHIEELMEHELKFESKVAYKLKESNVHCTGQFDKMKVSISKGVINQRTSVGLEMLSLVTEESSYQTTSWFVKFVNRWFELMTSRGKGVALSKHDMKAYGEAIQHLQDMQLLFEGLAIGDKGIWKPCQTGVRVACGSILGLQSYFLDVRHYKFLLTGRFTQDCLENLFSCIRLGQPVPHALAFKQHLKVITLAQYCTAVEGSSYDDDGGEYLVDFLSHSQGKANSRNEFVEYESLFETAAFSVPVLPDSKLRVLDLWEWAVIYDMSGSVLKSVQNTCTVCDVCWNAVLWHGTEPHPNGIIVQLRNYTEGALIEVSHDCFKAIMKCEITFRELRANLMKTQRTNVTQFFVNSLQYVWDGCNIPKCHNITDKILTRFFVSRQKIYGLKRKDELDKLGKKFTASSKSAAMREAVKKL